MQAGLLLASGMSALAFAKARPELLSTYGPPCLFHALTHLYCPGCGGTRAAILLLRGDLAGAIRMNVFAVVVMFCVPVGLIKFAATGKPIHWAGASGAAGKAIATFVIAFFVLRNVPFAPFTYLAPLDLKSYDAHQGNR